MIKQSILIVLWLLCMADIARAQDPYQQDANGDYIVAEAVDQIPYDPPWVKKDQCGLIRDLALRVSNVWNETNATKVFHNGNMKLHIFHPKVKSGQSPTPLPVIVYGYGGGFLSPYWQAGDAINIAKALAAKGYIVVIPEYRLGICLFEPKLAERAIARAVQDMRVVIRYSRYLTSFNYKADDQAPLTYLGGSSGAFIGIHNLYLNDYNKPTSVTDQYTVDIANTCSGNMTKNSVISATRNTYDLGTLNRPWMNGKPWVTPPGTDAEGTQDITVLLSGAIGNLDWIRNPAPGIAKPKALFMAQHRLDSVVPFWQGKAFKGFRLFQNPNFDYPTVYGMGSVDNEYQLTPSLQPDIYHFYEAKLPCAAGDDTCVPSDAGGETFRVAGIPMKTWYHNVAANGNPSVLQKIDEFIKFSLEILYPGGASPYRKGAIRGASLTIYPNPVSEQFQVVHPDMQVDAIQVYDIAGNEVDVRANTLQGKTTVNIGRQVPGTYTVRIIIGDIVVTRKIVIE